MREASLKRMDAICYTTTYTTPTIPTSAQCRTSAIAKALLPDPQRGGGGTKHLSSFTAARSVLLLPYPWVP